MSEKFAAIIGLVGVIVGASITSLFQFFKSKSDQAHQLRMAALEKRLATHQEAYTLWNELLWNIHKKDEVNTIAVKCQDWWYKNCLYLDPKTRKAFKEIIYTASEFSSANAKTKEKEFNEILKVGHLIAEGVKLPSIGKLENKKIQTKMKESNF